MWKSKSIPIHHDIRKRKGNLIGGVVKGNCHIKRLKIEKKILKKKIMIINDFCDEN